MTSVATRLARLSWRLQLVVVLTICMLDLNLPKCHLGRFPRANLRYGTFLDGVVGRAVDPVLKTSTEVGEGRWVAVVVW